VASIAAHRRPPAEGLGWRYEAHRRGLDMDNINLTTTDFEPFVDHFLPRRGEK
jgi:hypothetical protein